SRSIRHLPASAPGIAGSFLTQLFSSTRAKLPIHGQVFETVSRPLGCHWHPETADRPGGPLRAALRQGGPTTTYDGKQRRIDSVGVSTTGAFRGELPEPRSTGRCGPADCAAEE